LTKEQAIEKLKRSGIYNAFRQKRLDNFDITKQVIKNAKETAKTYLENYNYNRDAKNSSIIFTGQPGSGKTHLSLSIANELLDKNVGVIYMAYREVMPMLKSAMCVKDDDGENFIKAIRKYKDVPVLYIDDLFKGKITDSDKNIIFELVNYRYFKSLPIIISTEHDTEQLIDIDEATGSRIIEMSKKYIVEMGKNKGLNYRLRINT
jgi:DNA replication protein DnaC